MRDDALSSTTPSRSYPIFVYFSAVAAILALTIANVFLIRSFQFFMIGLSISFAFTVIAMAGYYITASKFEAEQLSNRIIAAEEIAVREPERAKPAWDVARLTLEAYFTRNLRQINMIFFLSVVVIVVSFAIMVWGISTAIGDATKVEAARLATGAGVLTQFIAGTFLLIYRTAIGQAVNYTITLERINSVGMAMQILDTMSDPAEKELTSKTKAELVTLLIKQVSADKPEPKAKLFRMIAESPDGAE